MTDRAADQGASRWEGRPVLSFLIRGGVFTIPILASVIVSIWLSKALPEPEDILGLVRWWAIILGGSTGVLFIVNFAARKFLPLAALMRMSMVFPDKAPGRFKTALRSGSSVKHLKAQLAEAERLGRHDDPDLAAEFILQLSNNLNSHDRRTRGHAERVRAYAEMLAEEMGLTEKERSKLRWASLLHDIGKLKISTDILNKPGRLDDAEWLEIKKHPTYGAEICAPLLEWLGDFADTIEDHHERFDGTGYPNGKKSDEISLGGRIVAVADAFDVMTTVRSYKAAMPGSAAREELARNAGGQFDPTVVRAFLNISMGRLRWVAGPLSWLAQLPFLRFVGAVQQVGTAVGVAGAAATGVAAVVGGGLVDLPGDEPLPLLPVEEIHAAALPTPTTVPVATLADDVIAGLEDEPVTFDLSANDGLTGAISIVDDPDFGRVVLNDDGTVTYIPNPDFSGEDAFTYMVDGAAPARVVVQVGPVNDLPLAVDDPAVVDEDGEVVIEVLGNDLDAEGLDPSTLRITSGPFNGTAAIDRATGAVTYRPNRDFSGTDGFTYVIADNEGAETEARVVIEVRQVNDPPEARDDRATTDEDRAVIVDVLANDSDPESTLDNVTVTRSPARGAATVIGGAIRYVPGANFAGTDSFEYRVCDADGACASATVTVAVRPVNDRPSLAAVPALRTDEDVPGTVDLLDGAADPDGDRLTLALPSASDAGGVLSVSGGVVTYDPPPDFAGSDQFAFTVNDGAGGTVAGVVSITVDEVNDPPVVPGPGPVTTAEDTPLTLDPLDGATDVDGDALTVTSFDASTAAGGTVVEGSLIYTPPPDFNGTDTFGYTVGDGRGGRATVSVTVEVTPANDAPQLAGGAFATDEDVPLKVAAPGVLTAATDVDGDLLTATVAAFPSHGALTLSGDGAFTYVPDADYSGPDAFAVTATDGTGGWATATFAVTVNPVNDPPVAAAGANTVAEDGVLVAPAPGVLAGASDAEGDALAAALVAGPDHGTVTLAADGGFNYVPGPDYHGTDSFTFAVRDPGGATGTAKMTIEVTPVPDAPAASPDAYALAEDGVLAVASPGVLDNDLDADGDALTAVLLTPPANGALTLGAAGGFTYTPDPHWNGTDSFTYEVDDGTGLTDNASVTLSVTAVNDPPVANDDAGATPEDLPVTVDVVGNDTDVEDGTPVGPVTLLTMPANGTLVDNGDGTLDYTPDPDWSGSDTFTYRVADGDGAASAPATVTVTVAPVNDAPVANDDSTTTPEDNPVVVAPVANDTDVEDGTPGGAVTLLGGPANGVVVDNGDGTLTYTPDPDWNGTDSFTYRVEDADGASSGAATVTIEVGVVNDPPVANDDGAATAEDTLVTVDVVANDSDVEDGTPAGAVTVITSPGNGTLIDNGDGTFDYTPDPDWNGVDSLTYQVQDTAGADSNVATVTVTVSPVNDDPVANHDAAATAEDTLVTVDVVANDTDLEDGAPDAATAALVAGAANGVVVNNGDGTFDYTPDPDWSGTDTFTYTVDDSAGATSNVATVTVTVSPVNDDPVSNADAGATAEDTLVTVDVVANDTDVEDGTPAGSVTVIGSPGNGTLIDNGDGTFDYTPDPDWSGVDAFTYTVDDSAGATSNTATVTITVSAVNDDPVANDDGGAGYATAEDTAFTTPDVVANDTDVEDGTPDDTTATIISAAANGTLIDNGDGTFDYTPDPDWSGVDAFTYTVDDSAGATSNVATVTVTVSPVNDDPVANDDGAATAEDTLVTVDVVANDTDVEDGTPDAATAALVAGPANGVVVNNVDGTFDYTPDPDWSGVDAFTYTVDDSAGATSNTATVTITVSAVNDDPVANADAGATAEDTLVVVDVVANDTDVEDGIPAGAVTLVGGPANGVVVNNGDGTFDYTPDPDWSGVDAFTYTVDDSAGATSNTATVTITVSAVNDDPVANDDGGAGYATAEDTAFTTADVVANDTDVEDGTPDPATVAVVTGPANGGVVNNGDGTFDYTPDPDFNGTDTFTYTVDDSAGATSNTATVSITVSPTNDPPVVDPVADQTEDEGVAVAFTATASDPQDTPPDTITFSLSGAPAGATIDPNTGAFSWTPTETQGPGVYTFDVVGTDDGTPPLADTEAVQITVNEVNQPPVLDPIGAQSGDELSAITFTATASDPDLPANTLSFSLAGAVPPGAGINAATGAFSWTPTEAQGPGAYSFDVVVSDGGSPTLSDSETITVTVNEANQPPVLDPIADPSGPEGSPITFTASASDPDVPAQGITYLLAGAPTGASINATTGDFTWAPTEAQGPGTYTFDVIAEDDAAPPLSDVDSVTVTVTEVNQPPTATNPGDQSSGIGQPVSVFVPAADSDLPPNTLTWDDGGTLPAGLSIDAATGEITGSATGAGTTTVTVTVDDGSLSDGVSFDWTVTATSADVKISEFRTTGPAGAADEFVELYNTGTAAQSLVGWTIQLYNGAGNPVGVPIALASGAVTDIQPKSWYLIAGSAYSGAATSDQPAFADNIAIGGGAELLDDLGNTVDLVGSANPAIPALPRMAGTNDQSYERRDGPGYGNCVDTGIDTDDFVHNMVASNPANSTAAAELCGTPPAPTVPVGPPHMVISEFRTSGPGGPNDEFVELFNPTQATIDLNGYEIRDSGGVAVHVFSAPTPVVAGGHYTVGNPPYSGASDANYSQPSTLANGDAVQLWDGSSVVDVVGTSGGVPFETRPLPPMTTSGSNEESYERVGGNCQDTDDNGADFFHNLASINPQTTADPATPCPSPAGDVIINEVLFAERLDEIDEMIEIYNAGSATYDLTGWMVADGNVPIADLDANPFTYAIPATDLHGSPSLLAPGEYAVIWLQGYAAKQGAPFAALEFDVALGLNPVLDETGDDVYLFDDGGQPIDYMRWGVAGEVNLPSLAWDPSFDGPNATSIGFQSADSLALTPNAVDTDSSACWERTGSGNASARCGGAPWTQRHDTDLRRASPGVDNNVPYPKSAYYGQVVINEVFYKNSGDQFVELANASAAPIDLAGWTVADGNLRIDELDGTGSSFSFTFPGASILPPGGHAVVWVQDPAPETQASPFADLEFWAGGSSSALKASADELWIYEPDLSIVDFMAWGSGGDVSKGETPEPLADFWDGSAQGPLGSPPANSSVSLTADGVDTDDSACWELTGGGASACGPTTVDNDDWPGRAASPGDDNNVATADLEVTVVADTSRPSNGGTVSYTVTVTNHSLSNAVSGVEVTDPLPAGLSHAGDDGGGAYVPATGVWTVGTVNASSSTALVIDATVTAAEGSNVDNTATITAAARPDPDGTNNADTESITVNRSPTPVNDATAVLQSIPATIAVLGNDSDPDGDPLTITAWDAVSAQGGTVDCSSGANCTYTGAPGFASPPDDTFTYTVDDGYGGTAVATVTVTVTPASGDPLFLKTDGTTAKGVVLPLAPPPFAATHPGTPAVPDWNDGGDGQPGRKLQRSGAAPPWDEDNEDKYQTWTFAVTDAAGLDIGGPSRLRLWAAMKDFDTLQIGEFFVRVSQCPPGAAPESNAADGCTSLGAGAYDSDPAPFAPSGGFEMFEVNVALPSVTIPQDDELRVKVIGGPGADNDIMVAFDTDATVSVLYFP